MYVYIYIHIYTYYIIIVKNCLLIGTAVIVQFMRIFSCYHSCIQNTMGFTRFPDLTEKMNRKEEILNKIAISCCSLLK